MNLRYIILVLLTFTSYFNYQIQASLAEHAETQGGIKASSKEQLEAWFDAACEGNLEVVQKLISKVDVNAQDEHNFTALMYAADYEGHENIVKLLLQHPEINVNVQDADGSTALIEAADYCHENIVKLLLQVPGININAQLRNGTTALKFAIKRNKPAITKLIQDKIDELTNKAFEAICGYNKATSEAERQHNIELLKAAIVQLGIKITDKDGDTLLHKAIKYKNIEIVRFLLLADPTLLEINNKDGKDAIELSVGYPEIFRFITTLVPKEKSCANCLIEDCTKKCSKCKKVFYCSAACQRTHWKTHKADCKPAE